MIYEKHFNISNFIYVTLNFSNPFYSDIIYQFHHSARTKPVSTIHKIEPKLRSVKGVELFRPSAWYFEHTLRCYRCTLDSKNIFSITLFEKTILFVFLYLNYNASKFFTNISSYEHFYVEESWKLPDSFLTKSEARRCNLNFSHHFLDDQMNLGNIFFFYGRF